MPSVPTPPVGAPPWVWGMFFLALIVGCFLIFWREIAKKTDEKSAAPAAPAGLTVMGGAFADRHAMEEMVEALEDNTEAVRHAADVRQRSDALLLTAVEDLRAQIHKDGGSRDDLILVAKRLLLALELRPHG